MFATQQPTTLSFYRMPSGFCFSLAHLTLQGSDAHVLLVQLLLLESDPLHQIINAFVLSLQHQLKKQNEKGWFQR